jgi:hypothetical protein
MVPQVKPGKGVPRQDVRLARAHYERGGPERKRVEGETEGLRRGVVACARQAEVAVAVPLGGPRPGRLGAVFYIPQVPCWLQR